MSEPPVLQHFHQRIKLKRIYIALLVLRLGFALFGPGYIHPDEHFQNGEIISARQLGVFGVRTWEWDPQFACRSIIPPAISTGIPYTTVLRLIWWRPDDARPRAMFMVERFSFFLASLVLDRSVYKLVPDRGDRMRALVLLASSYVMHTFQIRPFSNAIEAILVAASLRAYKSLIGDEWSQDFVFAPDLISLAVFSVLGVFTRPTFLAFTLPILIQAFLWSIRSVADVTSGQPRSSFLKTWLWLVSLPLALASVYFTCITVVDTLFFRQNLYGLVFTPLNFLKYNLSSSNLAEHGVHPRWLHLVVNLPLIVGPGLVYYGIRATRELFRRPTTSAPQDKGKGPNGSQQRPRVFTMPLFVILSGVGILSIFRHQEPRFLVPLLVPCIALVSQGKQIPRLGKRFWAFWVVYNLGLAIVYGVLHQGGVVPSLIGLHDRLVTLKHNAAPGFNGTLASVTYWKTYMPPWHLLAVSAEDVKSGKYILTDLQGAQGETMLDHIIDTPAQRNYLVAPLLALNNVPDEQRGCVELQERIFPHLDLDHVGEAMALGWKDGMTLGVFTVDRACLHPEHHPVEDNLDVGLD